MGEPSRERRASAHRVADQMRATEVERTGRLHDLIGTRRHRIASKRFRGIALPVSHEFESRHAALPREWIGDTRHALGTSRESMKHQNGFGVLARNALDDGVKTHPSGFDEYLLESSGAHREKPASTASQALATARRNLASFEAASTGTWMIETPGRSVALAIAASSSLIPSARQ